LKYSNLKGVVEMKISVEELTKTTQQFEPTWVSAGIVRTTTSTDDLGQRVQSVEFFGACEKDND
jgi:hypothetical protein